MGGSILGTQHVTVEQTVHAGGGRGWRGLTSCRGCQVVTVRPRPNPEKEKVHLSKVAGSARCVWVCTYVLGCTHGAW